MTLEDCTTADREVALHFHTVCTIPRPASFCKAWNPQREEEFRRSLELRRVGSATWRCSLVQHVIIFAFMRTLSFVCRYIGSPRARGCWARNDCTIRRGLSSYIVGVIRQMCDSSPLSRSDGLSWICEDDAYSVFCGHDGEADFA